MKKSIEDIDVEGKRVLMRVDFNVPLKDGKVMDNTRIRAALPSISYLLQKGARVILMSHLGRPKGKRVPEMSLKPVAEHLAELLDREVKFSEQIVGDKPYLMSQELQAGQVMLIENTRFDPREKKNDREFAAELAKLGDIFVNDAFGTAHRAHASTVGVAEYLPAVGGFLMNKELSALHQATTTPERPVLAIMGGAKVSDKILVIKNLLSLADTLVIGGGMSFTFLKVMGGNIGRSLFDEQTSQEAEEVLKLAEEKGVTLIFPEDVKIGRSLDEPILEEGKPKVVPVTEIPDDAMALDIGPKTIRRITEEVKRAKTVFWNGPMGVFENPLYSEGTMRVAEAILEEEPQCVIGGGDSVFALNKALQELRKELSENSPIHVSTGGGATLEFLGGKELPGVKALDDR